MVVDRRVIATSAPANTLLEKLTYDRDEYLRESIDKDFFLGLTGKYGMPIKFRAVAPQQGKIHTMSVRRGLSKAPVVNNETLEGKQEKPKMYESHIVLERYGKSVEIEGQWQAIETEVGASLADPAEARRDLYDFMFQVTNQKTFDALQGFSVNTTSNAWDKAKNVISIAGGLTRNNIIRMETNASRAGRIIGGKPRPAIEPVKVMTQGFSMQKGYILIVDQLLYAQWAESPDFIQLAQFDIKGQANNLFFTNVVGRIGNIIIMKAPHSASNIRPIIESGAGATREIGAGIGSVDVETSGLRIRDENGFWTGEAGFDETKPKTSRAILLGSEALLKLTAPMTIGAQEGRFGNPEIPYAWNYLSVQKSSVENFTPNNDVVTALAGYEPRMQVYDFELTPEVFELSEKVEEKLLERKIQAQQENDEREHKIKAQEVRLAKLEAEKELQVKQMNEKEALMQEQMKQMQEQMKQMQEQMKQANASSSTDKNEKGGK